MIKLKATLTALSAPILVIALSACDPDDARRVQEAVALANASPPAEQTPTTDDIPAVPDSTPPETAPPAPPSETVKTLSPSTGGTLTVTESCDYLTIAGTGLALDAQIVPSLGASPQLGQAYPNADGSFHASLDSYGHSYTWHITSVVDYSPKGDSFSGAVTCP